MTLDELLDMEDVGEASLSREASLERSRSRAASTGRTLSRSASGQLSQRDRDVHEIADMLARALLEHLLADETPAGATALAEHHRMTAGQWLLDRTSLSVRLTINAPPLPRYVVNGELSALRLRVDKQQATDMIQLSSIFAGLEAKASELRTYTRINGADPSCFMPRFSCLSRTSGSRLVTSRTSGSPGSSLPGQPRSGQKYLTEEQTAELREAFALLSSVTDDVGAMRAVLLSLGMADSDAAELVSEVASKRISCVAF